VPPLGPRLQASRQPVPSPTQEPGYEPCPYCDDYARGDTRPEGRCEGHRFESAAYGGRRRRRQSVVNAKPDTARATRRAPLKRQACALPAARLGNAERGRRARRRRWWGWSSSHVSAPSLASQKLACPNYDFCKNGNGCENEGIEHSVDDVLVVSVIPLKPVREASVRFGKPARDAKFLFE
jgi:hypothetical protein